MALTSGDVFDGSVIFGGDVLGDGSSKLIETKTAEAADVVRIGWIPTAMARLALDHIETVDPEGFVEARAALTHGFYEQPRAASQQVGLGFVIGAEALDDLSKLTERRAAATDLPDGFSVVDAYDVVRGIFSAA